MKLARALMSVMAAPLVGFVSMASKQNGSTGASLVINTPAGTVDGDVMVAVLSTDGGSAQTWAAQTGWTEQFVQVGVSPYARVLTRTAASEGASTTFTLNNVNKTLAGAILTFRGVSTITVGTSTTNTDPLVAPSISPAGASNELLAIYAAAAGSVTFGVPTDMVSRFADNGTGGPSFLVATQRVGSGATGTRSSSSGATTNRVGLLLSLQVS